MFFLCLKIKMLRRVDQWHCTTFADFLRKIQDSLTLVSLIANTAFTAPSNDVRLYKKHNTITAIKFLYCSPVWLRWPDLLLVPLPSAAANPTWHRFQETLINGGRRNEVFWSKGKHFFFLFLIQKWLTQHVLSTHFNNRPSSQIAVLTPLISTDICRLSSLPPSCFFNQINPNGHPLMASFF